MATEFKNEWMWARATWQQLKVCCSSMIRLSQIPSLLCLSLYFILPTTSFFQSQHTFIPSYTSLFSFINSSFPGFPFFASLAGTHLNHNSTYFRGLKSPHWGRLRCLSAECFARIYFTLSRAIIAPSCHHVLQRLSFNVLLFSSKIKENKQLVN